MKRILPLAALLFAIACAASSPAGTYEATLPAASGGGERTITLILGADQAASLSSAFAGRPSRFLVRGTWERSGDVVTVATERDRLVFDYAVDRLVAKEWDRRNWGEAGPGTLRRQH